MNVGKSIQQALDALPAHYHDCAHSTVSAECDCTATRDMGLVIQRLFEARDEIDRLDEENVRLRAAVSVCTTNTDLRDKLAVILCDQTVLLTDGEYDPAPADWHDTADALLPVILVNRARAVDEALERAAVALESHQATNPHADEAGRHWLGFASYVVRSFKSEGTP